ncbi:hypothetical protein RMP99_000551 [Salmonella enterica]|nr:hypothetical protein [Salmonella enterica]
MNRGIHPALAFAKQVEGWSPGVFSQVDKWRETDSLAPWRFMTFRQCKRRLADWLKRNPAPEEGVGKTGETCETSAQTGRKASTPHPAGQTCADFCRCPGRFRAQASTASAGSQYIRGQSLHTPSAPAPPCQQSPLAKLLEGQTHSGGGEKYAAEMEATTNRQWQGRRFSGSGHQIHERHRHIILN